MEYREMRNEKLKMRKEIQNTKCLHVRSRAAIYFDIQNSTFNILLLNEEGGRRCF
jgi:hypothetical protein